MMQVRKELVEMEKYEYWMVDSYTGTFICPCGLNVEDDGSCPEGHVSPLRQEKMI